MIGQIASQSVATARTRQRVWMIIVTVLGVLGLAAAVPGVLFGTYMAAFAADAPGTPTEYVMNIMYAVWIAGGVYVLLLIAGMVGGWIAFRKGRNRLSFGLSLMTALPIFLIILGILTLFVVNAVWVATL